MRLSVCLSAGIPCFIFPTLALLIEKRNKVPLSFTALPSPLFQLITVLILLIFLQQSQMSNCEDTSLQQMFLAAWQNFQASGLAALELSFALSPRHTVLCDCVCLLVFVIWLQDIICL